MMGDTGHFFYGGGFMWIFWILIIVALFFLFQSIIGNSSGQMKKESKSPLEILKKRYARGEIDEDEYERRRDELES